MKIALILAGQPRFYKEVFPTIRKHILDKYDCDVYAHAWWDKNDEVDKLHASAWIDTSRIKIDKDFSSTFIKLYNPTKFLFEPPLFDITDETKDKFVDKLKKMYPMKNGCDNLYRSENMLGAISRFFSIDKVFNLVEWEKNYEWIVFWRYDLRPDIFPDLSKLNKKVLYAYSDYHCTWCNRDEMDWPHNHSFIDTGFILHPEHKHILNIKNFYFNECIRDELVCNNGKWIYKITTPETIWGLNVWFHGVETIILPNNIFSASLIRGMDEYGELAV